MKRHNIAALLLLTVLLLISFEVFLRPSSASTSGAVIRVPLNYPTIQEAIDHAENGDTILVGPGVYYEHLSLPSIILTIVGEDGTATIVDGGGSGTVVDIGTSQMKMNGLTIRNGDVGICMEVYSTSLQLSNCTVRGNDIGIQFVSFAAMTPNTRIYHNSFVDNTQQAVVGATYYPPAWDYGYPFGGNYWSDYSGTDADHDGIGDTPYVINENNRDNYPLMKPWNPTLSTQGVTTWYWTSSTAINSVAVGDVDGDSQKETVTGGAFYDGTRNVAQLVVWGSSSMAVEQLTTWYWTGNTTINSIAVGDADGDKQNEIVTGGYYYDGTRQVAQLIVWNGFSLAVEGIRTWYWTGNTAINSVTLGDVDGDAQAEVVTGGYFNDGTRNVAQLVVWAGFDLSVDRLTTWYWTSSTVVNSVAIGRVYPDGQAEIVTGGSFNDGTRNVAQLVVWNGSSLAVKGLTSWYWTGNTAIKSVAVGDVDADGQTEIVTGGYFNDGTRNTAQLVVWTPTLGVDRLATWYWTGNTVINSIAVGDVNGDRQTEIVTGGSFNDGTRNVAQLVAWSGSSLAAKNIQTWYWVSDTVINSVCLSDISGDFSSEIVTGGAYNDGTRSNAQLAVWGMRQTV